MTSWKKDTPWRHRRIWIEYRNLRASYRNQSSDCFTCKSVNWFLCVEAATGSVLWKKMSLEISQNSQKNTFARVSFLIKFQGWGLRPATLLKKRPWRRCFPVNFATFLRTLFLQNNFGRLLLYVVSVNFDLKVCCCSNLVIYG